MAREAVHKHRGENYGRSVAPEVLALASEASQLGRLLLVSGAALDVLQVARLSGDVDRFRQALGRHREALLAAKAEAARREEVQTRPD